MRNFSNTFLLGAALITVLGGGAYVAWHAADTAQIVTEKTIKEHKPFLNIQDVKSPNGLSAWLVEDHSLPIVSIQFVIKGAGSAQDPDNKQGLSRLLSNTLDEGAGDMPSEVFQKALTDNSISLRFSSNRDGFGGSLVTLSRNKDKAFDLLALALSKPRFDSEAVERMKAANIARLQSSLSDPDWIASRLLYDRTFAGHAYAKNNGGTLHSLSTITPDDIRAFFQTHITRDTLLVSASGDITAQELSAMLDKVFAPLPTATEQQKDLASVEFPKDQTYLYVKDIPQTVISVAIPALDAKDPDYYPMLVMNYIFGGGGFGSRLMEEAREKRGLTYGIYSDTDDWQAADLLTVSTSTKNESAADMLGIIQTQMKRMADEPVSAKELQDAKSYLIGSMPLALDSTGDLSALALSLLEKGRPIDYLDHYADKINAVSIEDIQRVAKRLLNTQNMTTILVGNPANINTAQKIESLPNVQ